MISRAAIEAAARVAPRFWRQTADFEKHLEQCVSAALAAEGMALVPVGDVEKLRSALKGLSDMYSSTWDRVDGGLMMMESGVERFEKAHQVAYELLYPDRVLHDDDAMLKAAGASDAGK